VASSEVLRAALANGVSRATLFRAKKRLGVRARHAGQPGKGGCWYWYLPSVEEARPAVPKRLLDGEVRLFEQGRAERDEPVGTSSKVLPFPGVRPFDDTLRSTDETGALDL
jgi:hypothetical protein